MSSIEDEIMSRKFSHVERARQKLVKLKMILKDGYDWYMENTDGYHKSAEGMITISKNTASYFEDFKESWSIEVSSYVFCSNGRRFSAEGTSEEDVIDQAIEYFEKAIQTYINEEDVV